jgi:hypothetical protein
MGPLLLICIVGWARADELPRKLTTEEVFELWKVIPKYLDEEMIDNILQGVANESQAKSFKIWVHQMNSTFNHAHVSFIEESIDAEPPKFEEASGSSNPHCDVGISGPRTVKRVIPGQTSDNPFNKIPHFGFDLTATTTRMLNQANSPPGAASTSAGLVGMVGIMMVKNMVQSMLATGLAIVPPGIPPPVWNLMPLPCMPMVTGSNCFGSIMYPITFSDSVTADITDSALTGTIKQFRSTFTTRAGQQPDAVYQRCFKAYMSLMCGSIFPMCTNPQGRNEMIPFIGRVPVCFTGCLAVLAVCPGFGFADIAAPCSQVSIPPLCSQAVYLRDDLEGPQTIEEQLEGSLSTKCHNYDPEIDAGQDPLLYEEEDPKKLFHEYHDLQHEISPDNLE